MRRRARVLPLRSIGARHSRDGRSARARRSSRDTGPPTPRAIREHTASPVRADVASGTVAFARETSHSHAHLGQVADAMTRGLAVGRLRALITRRVEKNREACARRPRDLLGWRRPTTARVRAYRRSIAAGDFRSARARRLPQAASTRDVPPCAVSPFRARSRRCASRPFRPAGVYESKSAPRVGVRRG